MQRMVMREFYAIVAKYDLNEHPFYRAWRAGTLPPSALSAYAADYAPFIAAVEQGWRSLGDDDHANEEREHTRLWEHFRDAAGAPDATDGRGPNVQAMALAATAQQAFSDPATAVGALYAFEAQQPSTARSKLEGLRAHYGMSDDQTAYFRVHAGDYGERDRLAGVAGRLTPDERALAVSACETTCQAMWAALDGVMPVPSAAHATRHSTW
jgi:pyrroloquinoline-quinone synthase